MAVACVLLVLLLLAVGPRWDSVVFGIPLGAFLLGGVGGLMTLGCSPSWPRRLGSRRGVRVVALTFYRLVAAGALGGIVYVLAAALVDRDGGEMFLVALGAGFLEKPLSDGLLKWAGLLARSEADVFV